MQSLSPSEQLPEELGDLLGRGSPSSTVVMGSVRTLDAEKSSWVSLRRWAFTRTVILG